MPTASLSIVQRACESNTISTMNGTIIKSSFERLCEVLMINAATGVDDNKITESGSSEVFYLQDKKGIILL